MRMPESHPSKIHAITPHGRDSGSCRVRVFEWLERTRPPAVMHCYLGHRNSSPAYLARHPLAVSRAELQLRRTAGNPPERLLLHREASPLSRGGLERALLERAGMSIYDFDDALHCDEGKDRLIRRLAPKAPKALAAVRAADRVIAGNAGLADWASAHNRDVRIIPSCVSPSDYRQPSDHELHDPPRLGWIGQEINEPFLGLLAEALVELNRRTAARLVLIGSTARRLGPLERLIDRVPWSKGTEKVSLSAVDVGLMPLPDDPYSRGKCGYKLLQYSAATVPFVASPVGVNSEILARTGMPAVSSPAEWLDAITELLAKPAAERQRLGHHAVNDSREALLLPRLAAPVGRGGWASLGR